MAASSLCPKETGRREGRGTTGYRQHCFTKVPPSPPTHTLLVLATYNVLLLLGLSPRLEDGGRRRGGGGRGGLGSQGNFPRWSEETVFPSPPPPSSVPQLLSSPACSRIHQFKIDLNERTEVRCESPSLFSDCSTFFARRRAHGRIA